MMIIKKCVVFIMSTLLTICGFNLVTVNNNVLAAEEDYADINSDSDDISSTVSESYLAGNSFNTSTAISTNKKYTGVISSSNTSDYYKFTINSSGRIDINAQASIGVIGYYIYNNQGNKVWSEEWIVSDGTTGISNLRTPVYLNKGTYYFVVKQCNKLTGNYNFSLNYLETNESYQETGNGTNNSFDTANVINTNTKYIGQLCANDDKDFYKFVISSSGKITVSNIADIGVVKYCIYDESGFEIWSEGWLQSDRNTGKSSINEEVFLTRGVYYFAVIQCNSLEGVYNLKLNYADSRESFPESNNGNNNEFSKANKILLNRQYQGQLAANDTKDFYQFTLTANGKLGIQATAKIGVVAYHIYDAYGNEKWEKGWLVSDSTGQSILQEEISLSAGTYYFAIMQCNSRQGTYSFKLSPHSHNYQSIVTKATTSSDGKIVKQCSCGEIQSTAIIYHPVSVLLSSDIFIYNGKENRPSVTVKDSSGEVIGSSNYSVIYSSMTRNVGIYNIDILFKGYYSGSIKKSFKIVPSKTAVKKLKSKSRGFTVKLKKVNSQITGYQIQYSTNRKFRGAKVKTIRGKSKTSITLSNLKRRKRYYVRVRTYKKIAGYKYYSYWSSSKSIRVK